MELRQSKEQVLNDPNLTKTHNENLRKSKEDPLKEEVRKSLIKIEDRSEKGADSRSNYGDEMPDLDKILIKDASAL
jgi:hypothetical protein